MADHDEEAVKLALLAHDLRTPLGAMRLTAELIGAQPLSDQQSEHLSILIRSIDALSDMTGDLVQQAGSSAGSGVEAPDAPSSMAGILEEVMDLFQVAATAKGLKLETDVDAAARALHIRDAVSFRRVVTTLLDNAVKYTETGGVCVRLESHSDPNGNTEDGQSPAGARLSVTDSGPGIDPEEAARLFRPFVRGRRGRASGAGSGLGLWGTELLVKALNGRLTLETPEGGGSRFVVDLPAGAEATEQGTVGEIPAGEGAEPSALQAMHVLVVDDNETNCRLLAALLESFGVSADIAGSGPQAIALVEKAEYDAVLLDLHMPEMSGVETAERLRAQHVDQSLPLIAVTAALETAGDDSLRAAGFQDVLTKPLSPTALYDVLAHLRR